MLNGFSITEYTQTLQKVIQEVVNDPTTYLGSKYLPSVAIPTDEIYTEVIEATGGLTNEHVLGTDPTYIQNFGTRVQKFAAPSYREGILYDEKKLMHLRKLGQNDRSQRGIQQYIDKSIDQLNRRLEARIEKARWDAIFNGGFTYASQTFSYGVPAGNRATPIGAVWSSDGVRKNDTANPLEDLRYWLMAGYANFRKYTITKIIMNKNTARWILDNANTKAYVQNGIANPNISKYDINDVLSFFFPGCPPVEVYGGWYQEQTIVDGKITVGNALQFIPDGYIFFEASLPGGDMVGEFVQGLNLQSGTLNDPGVGKYLLVEENIAAGTKGGPSNPHVSIWGGVNGGVKMDRPFDLLTAKVIA